MNRASRTYSIRATALIVTLVAFCATVLLQATKADAAFDITAMSAESISGYGASAPLDVAAGAHPFASVLSVTFRTITGPNGVDQFPDESVRTFIADLPAGFIGNPGAVPVCEPTSLAADTCSPATQVGLITLHQWSYGAPYFSTAAVFNVRAPRGAAAAFAFKTVGVPITIVAKVNPESNTVTAVSSDISQAVQVLGIDFVLWGDPANPTHDGQRGAGFFCPLAFDDPSCAGDVRGNGGWFGGKTAGIPSRPFLTNPTYCGQAPQTAVRARSWQEPERWVRATHAAEVPAGCDELVFDPSVNPQFESTRAETPTGLRFGLEVPQSNELPGVATPTLRRAAVTLPQGVSLNPSVSDGLEGCTDAQIGLRTDNPITCPDASNIGDVTVTSPLLAERLTGPIYVGQPVAGKTYRVFVVAENPLYGISIRLEGVLHPDPVTGQITTVFDDNPQLPFSNFDLHFRGGDRAPLATPQTCSSGQVTSQLTPWSDPNVVPSTPSSNVNISWDGNGAPCPPPAFAPSFKAGSTTPVAGASGKFTMTFGREDRERYLNDIVATLPKGLVARLGDVPLCPDGAANAGTCDAKSQVGTTTTGAGVGPTPFFLPGRVYLTGRDGDAPFGLSIVVPAKAGPFDLGTVVVRAKIYVDRNTAQVRVVSRPLPQILEGIPLRLRKVNVTIDRDRFMVNPKRCGTSSVDATIGSVGGPPANVSTKFSILGCTEKRPAPSGPILVGARGKLNRGQRTPLDVTIGMTPDQTNLRSVRVTLPLSLNARLDVVNKRRACTLEQFQADRCPMIVGEAVATTPVLRDPLRGPAYFVYTPARRLPDLVVRLRGAVAIDLVGKVTITRDLRLQTAFDTIPDVPVTKFRLRLASGPRNGPIGLTRNACAASTRRGLKIGFVVIGQNGKTNTFDRQAKVVGCGGSSRRTTRRASAKKK